MTLEKLTAMLNRYSQRLADTEMQAASALADAHTERQRADTAEARVQELESSQAQNAEAIARVSAAMGDRGLTNVGLTRT